MEHNTTSTQSSHAKTLYKALFLCLLFLALGGALFLNLKVSASSTWADQGAGAGEPGSQNWTSIASSADGTKLAAVVNGGDIWTATGCAGGNGLCSNWVDFSGSVPGAQSWTSISLSSDGTKFAAVSNGGYIWIGDCTTSPCSSSGDWSIEEQNGGAGNPGAQNWTSVSLSSDGTYVDAVEGNYIWSGSGCGTADCSGWGSVHFSTMMGTFSSVAMTSENTAAAVAADGYVSTATGCSNGECADWFNFSTTPGAQNWTSIASSADGTKLVAAVSGGDVWVGDCTTSPCTSTGDWTWTDQGGSPGNQSWSSVASSADGTKLAATSDGGDIWVATGCSSGSCSWADQSSSLFGGTQSWTSIASSSDGAELAAVGNGSHIWTSYVPVATPTVTTGSATSITQGTVTLGGNITAIGGASPTSRGINYGLTSSYGSTSPADTGSFSTGAFTENITGLACGQTYHYQAFAANTGGAGDGSDATFTTASCTSVTNVTSSAANGSYDAGKTIPIQIVFSAPVTASGTPGLTLVTGASATSTAPYVSGSGTNTLTFDYTVAPGDTSSRLEYASTTALFATGGASIVDMSSGQNAKLSLPSPSTAGSLSANTDLVIDTTAPVLSETTPVPTPASNDTPSYTFTSSEAGTIAYSGGCASATTAATAGLNTVTFSTLAPGTYASCALTVTDAAGNVSAPLDISSFTIVSSALPPSLTTGDATAITETSATLAATMTSVGSAEPTARGFDYGASDSPYDSVTSPDTGTFSTGAFTENITGLACGQTYHYEAFATNTAGTGDGSDATFTTASCPGLGGGSGSSGGGTGNGHANVGNGSGSGTGSTTVTTQNNSGSTTGDGTTSNNSSGTTTGDGTSGTNSDTTSNTTSNNDGTTGDNNGTTTGDGTTGGTTGGSSVSSGNNSSSNGSGASGGHTNSFIPPTATTTPEIVGTGSCAVSAIDTLGVIAGETKSSYCETVLSFHAASQQIHTIFTSKKGSVAAETVATVGVVAGSSAAVASLLFLNPVSFSELFLIPFRLWSLLLAALGLKKRRRPWGTVYDSVTKQPLDPAYVVLRDSEGKEIGTTFTDLDGRFGFVVPGPGNYMLVAQKTNYLFPSQQLVGRDHDELYRDLYFGEHFFVSSAGEVVARNIPMDPEHFDWNEFAKKSQHLMKFYSVREKWLTRISNTFFVLGFAVATLAIIAAPKNYNIAIFVLYLVLLLIRTFGVHARPFGHVADAATKLPIPFAIVRVSHPDTGVELIHRITDAKGKYYCLLPNGKYVVRIDRKLPDGTYQKAAENIPAEVTKGFLSQTFTIL